MGKHTLNELNNLSQEELITIILSMLGQLDVLNENIEKLREQIRIANSYRFGRHTETLKSIDGHLSFFDEAEIFYDASAKEPYAEEVIPPHKKKAKGQRELNLKEFPKEIIPTHSVSEECLNEFYGEGNWHRMPKGCAMSRNPVQWKSIPWKYMSERMATIRMNSCVETVQRIYCATASSHFRCLRPS